MNIFALDKDPEKAAMYLAKKHIDKMAIESCQMLASALWHQHGVENKDDYLEVLDTLEEKYYHFPRQDSNGEVNLYGVGFMHHPSTRWVFKSKANALWLARHSIKISELNEQTYERPYACTTISNWFLKIFQDFKESDFSEVGLTEFSQAMPDEYKIPGDPVQAYRDYYIGEKVEYRTWEQPRSEWFMETGK